MRKLFKFIGWLIGIAIVLIIVAAIAIPLFFDPNDFKPQITQAVREKTGRELTIDGDIKLSLFPWLGLEIGPSRLANAPGFTEPDFAALERIDVRIKLLPLLGRELQMDTVTLSGLRINLARNAQNQTNWDDLRRLGEPEPPESESQGPEQRDPESSQAPLEQFHIGGLDIQNARFSWRDEGSGERLEITDLDLRTGAIEPGQAFPITLGLQARSPDLDADLKLSGELSLDPLAQRYRVAGLDLSGKLTGEAVPAGEQTLALRADVDVDMSEHTLSVNGLGLNALGMQLEGTVNADNIPLLPELNGQLRLVSLNPREVLDSLQQPLPQTADPNVLQSATGSISFSASPLGIKLTELTAKLDDTTLEGSIDAPFTGALGFKLRVDAIDLDRYLPPHDPQSVPPVKTPGAATAERAAAGELPLEPLRALQLDGQLSIGELKVNNLRTSDVVLPIKAANGKLTLSPAGKLYSGSYQGTIGIDASSRLPVISVEEQLTGVQAEPLLVDLLGEAKITGTAEAQATLTMQGADARSIRQTLNGVARFSFRDGAVKGINIGRLLREAKAKLAGQALSSATEPAQTDFSELSASVNVTDGIARNDDLAAKSPLLRVTGQGSADLVQERIDYLLTAVLVSTPEGQGGRELQELKGIPIPIKISGSFEEPRFGLDLAAVLQTQTQRLIDEKADKALQQAQERLEEKINKEVGDKVSKELSDQVGEQAGEALKGQADKLLKGLFGN